MWCRGHCRGHRNLLPKVVTADIAEVAPPPEGDFTAPEYRFAQPESRIAAKYWAWRLNYHGYCRAYAQIAVQLPSPFQVYATPVSPVVEDRSYPH